MFIVSMTVKGVQMFYSESNSFNMTASKKDAFVFADGLEVSKNWRFMSMAGRDDVTLVHRVAVSGECLVKKGSKFFKLGLEVGDYGRFGARTNATTFRLEDAKFFANEQRAVVVMA